MAVRDLIDWTHWTVLPQTSLSDGLEDFEGIQFAYPRRDIDYDAWYNSFAFTIGGMNNDRKLGITGFLVADSADEWGVFRSGPVLTWDFITENIPAVNSVNEHIPLYSVIFPDSHLLASDQPDRLEVRAGRSVIYTGRQIGTSTKYGTYVNLGFSVWRIRNTGGTEIETRITTTAFNATIYKDDDYDVEDVETRLEFFYLDLNARFELLSILHLPPEEENEILMGDFLLGISSSAQVTGEGKRSSYILWMPMQESFSNVLSGLPVSTETDPIFGEGSSTGGYGDDEGTHDFHSDKITYTGAPSLSALSGGFVNAYKVSASLLQNLGKCLFPQLSDVPATSTLDALKYLVDTIYNKGSIDYVIDCHIVPVNVPATSYSAISCGGKQLINPATDKVYGAYAVDNMYVTKSCGIITTPEAFGNFLDYTVRCKLYLPCYGYVDIPPEYWNGGAIGVDYIFNIFDGTFVALVSGKAKHSALNSLIGQYSGSACTHIPVNGRDYSQVISGLATIAVGTGVGIATGGSALGLMGTGMAGSGLGAVLGSKQPMVSSGSSNSSSAMMMHKKPYIIIEYPTSQFSTRYPKEKGLPLNVAGTLGQFGGLTIAENPILNGIPCTENEKIRIKNALKEGLIFR